MFECMRRHGVDEHEHLSLLADANMNHEIITDLRSQLTVLQHRLDTLQAEHTSLQAEHAVLQAERAHERDDSAAMRAALQNLSCVPYNPMRRGFEICRILKCT
jgi:peptidoglycan hydrolase CwlO-like protein